MVSMMSRAWWLTALRGVIAILFGIMAFIWPQITLTVLVLFFGAYIFVDGIFALVAAIQGRTLYNRWWILLLEGLAGIVIGILTFMWPQITALVLLMLIAAWAIITGVFEIVAAISLRKEITGEWMLIVAGVLSVIFGLLLVMMPGTGALALIWLIAAYAIVFGIVLLVLAFKLRNWAHTYRGTPAT